MTGMLVGKLSVEIASKMLCGNGRKTGKDLSCGWGWLVAVGG